MNSRVIASVGLVLLACAKGPDCEKLASHLESLKNAEKMTPLGEDIDETLLAELSHACTIGKLSRIQMDCLNEARTLAETETCVPRQ